MPARSLSALSHSLIVAAALSLPCGFANAQVTPEARGRKASPRPASTATTSAPAAAPTALVSDVPCPDPFAYYDGADWYIFGTGAKPYLLQGHALAPGAMHKVPLDLDYAGFTHPVAQIWGFHVYRDRDGSHHAYATLHLGGFRTVIGHFAPRIGAVWSPGRPITGWKLDRMLVGNVERRDWYAYDAKAVVDEDGSLYLIYVTRRGRDNQIVARRLAAPDRVDDDKPLHTLLEPSGLRSEDRNDPGGMQLVEGPNILRHRGKSILLYSVGDFHLNNYKLGVAYAERLIPPDGTRYQKVLERDTHKIWGEQDSACEVVYVLQSQKNGWPHYCGELVIGPGAGSVILIGNAPWLLFHGYRPDDTQRHPENRFVFKLPLRIDIRGQTPSSDWVTIERPRPTARPPAPGHDATAVPSPAGAVSERSPG